MLTLVFLPLALGGAVVTAGALYRSVFKSIGTNNQTFVVCLILCLTSLYMSIIEFLRGGRRTQTLQTWWLFERGVAICNLLNFLSWRHQIIRLVGERGILPHKETLKVNQETISWLERRLIAARQNRIRIFMNKYVIKAVSLISGSDWKLKAILNLGVILSAFLLVYWKYSFLWWAVFFLSIVVKKLTSTWSNLQWDILIIEVNFLTAILSPFRGYGLLPALAIRMFMFRFMLASGASKLLSGCRTWREFTALSYHYETQPLPTTLAWWAHQLPDNIHKSSTLLTLIMEIIVPFLGFWPFCCRYIVFSCHVGIMCLISLTGIYGIFNITTIVLSIPQLDDSVLPIFVYIAPLAIDFRWISLMQSLLGVLLGAMWLHAMDNQWGAHCDLNLRIGVKNLFKFFDSLFETFYLDSTYGLFASMTTVRNEVIIQGSDDGYGWTEYQFWWKPTALYQKPRNLPFQMPRVDWAMWFLSLRRSVPQWFTSLIFKILSGDHPEILTLFHNNSPWPDCRKPPKYIRAVLYRYNFTNFHEMTPNSSQFWWKRTLLGTFYDVARLPQTPRIRRTMARTGGHPTLNLRARRSDQNSHKNTGDDKDGNGNGGDEGREVPVGDISTFMFEGLQDQEREKKKRSQVEREGSDRRSSTGREEEDEDGESSCDHEVDDLQMGDLQMEESYSSSSSEEGSSASSDDDGYGSH